MAGREGGEKRSRRGISPHHMGCGPSLASSPSLLFIVPTECACVCVLKGLLGRPGDRFSFQPASTLLCLPPGHVARPWPRAPSAA